MAEYAPFLFFTPFFLCLMISAITIAKSSFAFSSFASLRYIQRVTNGVWPFTVINVEIWYWRIWTPSIISCCVIFSTSLFNSSSLRPRDLYLSLNVFLLSSTNGDKCAILTVCPPYWELATCAMICVAILHAVENLWGLSIFTLDITVPFWSISSRSHKQQFVDFWAK